eukprot:353939-Chlamydomonas_euryale.AAC.6
MAQSAATWWFMKCPKLLHGEVNGVWVGEEQCCDRAERSVAISVASRRQVSLGRRRLVGSRGCAWHDQSQGQTSGSRPCKRRSVGTGYIKRAVTKQAPA